MVRAKTLEQFIEEARSVHGDLYDYSKTEYKTYSTKLIVIEVETGKEFLVYPDTFLKGAKPSGEVSGHLNRTCNLCNEMMTTPSKKDLSGFIKHGEEHHPNHWLSKTYDWREKKYQNAITGEWFGSRKYLARSLKAHDLTNEQYYLKYGETHMPDEWNANNNDSKYGNGYGHDCCIECGKKVSFDSGHWQYSVFCGFSCSTTWHAKNTDRVARSRETISQRLEDNPDHGLRPNQLRYWTNKGFSEEEAKEKVKERQTTVTLEKFIERYGEEEGKKRYVSRQEKWFDSLKESGMFSGYSKISEELFNKLQEHIDRPLMFGKNEHSVRSGKTVYKVDCYCEKMKKVIEFNGDYWHANPKIYEETFQIHGKRSYSAKEKWEADKEKIELLKEKGYDVMVIWESDYRENPDLILGKCIGFMM